MEIFARFYIIGGLWTFFVTCLSFRHATDHEKRYMDNPICYVFFIVGCMLWPAIWVYFYKEKRKSK